MQLMKHLLFGCLLIGNEIPQGIFNLNLTSINSQSCFSNFEGQNFCQNIQESCTPHFTLQFLDFTISCAGPTSKSQKSPRSYERGFSKKEQEIIGWIVNTLAWKKVHEIIPRISELKSEGDKLQSMHPLRFCEVILIDEKLKCGMHCIRTRIGLIKNDFFAGITKTLAEESARQNLKVEYIQDFARNVKIDFNLIYPLLDQGKWMDFVDCLIDEIPRENNPERYNM